MLNFDDPFTRKAVKVFALFLAFVLAIPSFLGLLISIDYFLWPENTGSQILVTIFHLFPNPDAPRVKDLLGLLEVFIAAIPAALIGVAIEKKSDGTRGLNRFGWLLILVFVISLVFAIVAYLMISPESWGSNHRLELDGLRRLIYLVHGSLQASVFYLALLLGLRAVK